MIGLWQIFLLLITASIIILPIIALISILKNEFDNNNKIIWVLVVIFLPIVGSVFYFSIGRNQIIK